MGSSSSKPTPPTVKPRDTTRVTAARQNIEPILSKFENLKIQGQILLAPPSGEFELGGDGDDVMDGPFEAYHKQRERPFYLNDCNYPSVIILPETFEDVSTVIKMMKGSDRQKYRLCIAGGCHSHYGMIDNAICLDLCHLRDVTVNTDSKEVTMGGGCKIQDVHEKLKGTGLGFATGTNPDTGVSGLTMAGGAGYLGPQAGFACDTVTQIKVVIPSGEIVTATDTNEHKDLLRAIRGGGGNFGVVVEWTFKLYDVSNAFGGIVVHMAPTLARIKIVLSNYMKISEDDPPNSSFSMFVMPAGAPVFITVLSMIGDDVKDAKTYKDIPYLTKASSLGAWFRPEITLGRKDYITEIAPMLEAVQQRCYAIAIGAMVYSMDDTMLDAIIHFTRVDYPKSKNVKPFILFTKLGGEMNRNDGSRSSIRHRKATGWLICEAGWEPHATDEEIADVKDWAKRAKKRIIELGGEDGPHNFADTDGRRIKFFTEEQRSFLEGAKNKYDPTNLFAMNKNIVLGHTE